MKAYREATLWQEVLSIALSEKLPASEIVSLSVEIANELENTSRYSEAGIILLEYTKDAEEAVRLLCKGNEFSEARRVCAGRNRGDLIETHLKTALMESHGFLMDDVEEMRNQLVKQLERIGELKVKKEENPSKVFIPLNRSVRFPFEVV